MPHPLLHFVCLFSTALALAPATAHVMELPNKISLPKAEYQVAQQLYRGWALVGVIVVIALVSNLTLALSLPTQQEPFVAALIACLCIVGTQAIFWLVTFPINRRTKNWTVFPENWDELRKQWEYSHVASAVLNVVAFVAVILAVLWSRNA